uniref:Uncharacterized protein n=1 Tax=Trachysalambria curvirostris nimavirus TaxID=2984282 RepID=A0A9C7BWV5_9VIRU|nr:MAG: hypothetical protein [Trachysalambria curvirostris nimavirus]
MRFPNYLWISASESAPQPGDGKPKMVPKRKFRHVWMTDPAFQPWLSSVEDDPEKASCIFCKKQFGALLTTITRHRETKIHIYNARKFNDHLPQQETLYSTTKKTPKRKLRDVWKTDPALQPWLSSLQDDPEKASFIFYKKQFGALLTTITRHRENKTHVHNARKFDGHSPERLLLCGSPDGLHHKRNLADYNPAGGNIFVPVNHTYLGHDMQHSFQGQSTIIYPSLITYVRLRCRDFLITFSVQVRIRFLLNNEFWKMASYLSPRKQWKCLSTEGFFLIVMGLKDHHCQRLMRAPKEYIQLLETLKPRSGILYGTPHLLLP